MWFIAVSQLPDDQHSKLPEYNHQKYQDANKTFDYCGRTHAQKYMLLQQEQKGGEKLMFSYILVIVYTCRNLVGSEEISSQHV